MRALGNTLARCSKTPVRNACRLQEELVDTGGPSDNIPWWRKVKRRELPDAFWDARRKANNAHRAQRYRENRRARAHSQLELDDVCAARGRGDEAQLARQREDREGRVQANLLQKARFQDAMENGLNVVVECAVDSRSQVDPRELRSLARQLQTAAGANRKHATPLRLSFTSFDGALKEHAAAMHAAHWKAHIHAEPFCAMFPDAAKVTVLSPDASEELQDMDDGRVYVIGGIVDRTVRKDVTMFYAHEHGYQTRKLPLQANVDFVGVGMPHGKWNVLNVDDVVRALLEFRRTKDWKIACNAAVPLRKRRLL